MEASIKLVAIESTPFLARDGDGLRQLTRVRVENAGAPAGAWLSRSADGQMERFDLGAIPTGESELEVLAPELCRPTQVTWQLEDGSNSVSAIDMLWQPQRHWEIHLVHGSHHDLGYTDIPSNVLREHDRHLEQVLDYCDQTADWPGDVRFRYTVEQAWSILHFLEHACDETRTRAVRLMRQGRIEVTALMGNQTSELCGHEEQIRLLYPAFRLKRRYRVPIETAELNDIPGVSWGLITVLSGAGIRYFAPAIPDYFAWGDTTCHYIWDESRVLRRGDKGAFWWEGPDGSRVLLWYGGPSIAGPALWTYSQTESVLSEHLGSLTQGDYPYDLVRCKFHGGMRDNAPPDVRLSMIAREWNERWAYPRLIVSTNARFFRALERTAGRNLAVLRGDLPNTDYTMGALSTAKETGINRLAHDALTTAEKLATCATMVSDYEYPSKTLAEAYDCALLFDEHTWGMSHPMGPAQAANRAQKVELAYRAAALAHDILCKSANKIADQVSLTDEGYHIVVANPLAYRRTDLVRVQAAPAGPCGQPMYWRHEADGQVRLAPGTAIGRKVLQLPPDLFEAPFDLVDLSTGHSAPCQIIRLDDPLAARPDAARRWSLGNTETTSHASLNHSRGHLFELAFLAEDVPSLGYKTYRIVPGIAPHHGAGSLSVGDTWLENRFYRIELDHASGRIASIWDKELSRELVDEEAQHGVNQLVVRALPNGALSESAHGAISRGESGPVLASLAVRSTAVGCPQLTQEITLYESIKRIDFCNRLLRDATPLLEHYFAFPFGMRHPQFRYEASNAVVAPIVDQLPGANSHAYPMQHWVSVRDAEAGITWSSLESPVVQLGGLCPLPVSQAHHAVAPPGYGSEFLRDPAQLQRGHIYSCAMVSNWRTNFDPVQVGDMLFRYSLTSHPGDWRESRAWQPGWAASTPLEPTCVMGPQMGTLGVIESFLELDQPNVLLLTAKLAEDGDGIILRFAETAGEDSQVRIHLPRIDIGQAIATNLVEEDRRTLDYDRHNVTLRIPAHGIATVRCRIDSAAPTGGAAQRALWPVDPCGQ